MTDLLPLGKLYVSDFLAPGEEPRADPFDLTLVMDDDTGIVHLAEQPPPELMWGRYWYRSGTNATMRDELAGIVKEIVSVADLCAGDLWVDIASNDGTLLAATNLTHGMAYPINRVGVDPCSEDIAGEARKHGTIIQQSFTRDVARDIAEQWGKAKVVTCIAMFYDLLDPTDFLAGVKHLLAEDGVFVLQMSYTPLMLEQMAFDNICHEHARYYTLTTLENVLERAGFIVVDCTINDTNGGSFRVYAMHSDANMEAFATRPHRDVARMRTRAIRTLERVAESNSVERWKWFAQRLEHLRHDVYDFVTQARADGAEVWGYGASTKGNTLLQYFGLNHTLITAIAERQPGKVGLRTVGTNIPIVSEDDWRSARPEYTLMLPWHFVASFLDRERKYLEDGGKFIVPCPRFQVIGA